MRLRAMMVATALSGIIGGLIGAGAVQLIDSGDENGVVSAPETSNSEPDDGAVSTAGSNGTACLTAADIYERVRPAIVQITSTSGQSGGTGTGIVFDKQGHIITNYHVLSGATSIEVRLSDGSTLSAEIVGSDPANDLAVIKIDASAQDLSPVELGDSDALRVGDPVLAIGNPFNLEATLTQGIVSAIDRTYATGGNTRPIREMIQTDAAVNPGNSGGPLLNCRGQVVGINTLLENPTGENVNVGVAFAVAINTAKQSLAPMLAGQTVSHAWLGIAGVDVTPALAGELNLGAESGVYVTLVSNGSPADDAGLQGAFVSAEQASGGSEAPPGGDVILTVDGTAVTSLDDLATYLGEEKHPGDIVELTVLRDDIEVAVEAELAEWPA